MPRLAACAVRTPWGDADATLAALTAGRGDQRPLADSLLADLVALGREVLAGAAPDLVLLATTKGDLPRWCDDLLDDDGRGAGGPADLARALAAAFAAPAIAVSAACASGTTALGVAARRIASGGARRVLILGGDRLAPFVSEGFAALRALDPAGSRPFSADRAGLALGETRSAILLDDDAGGLRLAGWGGRMDANHLTAPDRQGSGLLAACRVALAGMGLAAPDLIVAHGTGTRANDDAESLAYAALCAGVPVTATKGLLGHSLGACGLTDTALAARALAAGSFPGVAVTTVAGCAGAIALLSPGRHALAVRHVLVANAGFAGINSAVVLARAATTRRLALPAVYASALAELTPEGWSAWTSADGPSTGKWSEAGVGNALPRLSASDIIGRSEPSWGRMDLACRALIALGRRLGPLPGDAAIVLVSDAGCVTTDRIYERDRRAHGADAQRFVYTLPTTPIGEASIRLGIRGPGLALLGADDAQAEAIAAELLADGVPAVLLARLESDHPPHVARAQLLRPR